MVLNKKIALIMLSAAMASNYADLKADLSDSSALVAAGNMAKTAALTIGTLAASTTLALGAHIATEYPIVYLHECGHAFTRGLPQDAAITIECNLKKHPLAVLLPFTGSTGGFGAPLSKFKDTLNTAAGPIIGITAAYGSIVLAHAGLSLATGGTLRDGLNSSYTLPLSIYKNLASGISETITQKSTYTLPSFLRLAVGIFTLLKASKMFGEFLYGLTPISTENGDGHTIWKNLGLKKNLTVEPMVGLGLAVTPMFAAIGYGVCRGIYNHL